MITTFIRIFISLTMLLVAVLHTVNPDLSIDSVTIFALVVAVLPWLHPLFKSVELPGGLKVEFQEVERASTLARAAGLGNGDSQADHPEYSFQIVAEHDPNLALAGLRIEIERRLCNLARQHGYQGRAYGIGNLLRHLESQSLLSREESRAIEEIVKILNEAIHGASIDRRTAQLALDTGTSMLLTLESRITKKSS